MDTISLPSTMSRKRPALISFLPSTIVKKRRTTMARKGPSVSMGMKETTTILDLPLDLSALILDRLDRRDLNSMSLVSKSFLSVSSTYVHKLTFSYLLSFRIFTKLVNRFPYVKEITLSCLAIDHALNAISNSCLNLDTLRLIEPFCYPDEQTLQNISSSRLRNLKSLQLNRICCSYTARPDQEMMIQFIQLFPLLIDLDLSTGIRWDDDWIRKLTEKFPNLRKINLHGNKGLTDVALTALSANCFTLQEVNLNYCRGLTPQGICTLLRRSPQLTSLEFPRFKIDVATELAEALPFAKKLNHLSLKVAMRGDRILSAIARTRPQLTSFKFDHSYATDMIDEYTMSGLNQLFKACRGLTRLELTLPRIGSGILDREMSRLVKHLSHLKHMEILSSLSGHRTLFSLIRNCPSLETIEMRTASFFPKNCHNLSRKITAFDLSGSIHLRTN
uniref:F-box domain-containing protein n=1 Tax=Kalanchoe fedtschenkoi TaxID=63787 RepID=A0A7N1A4K4_KALFE